MMIKIIGLGLSNYVKDRVNVFDAIIVLVTVAESITQYAIDDSPNNASTSTFRAIRLLRFFKIARTFKSFQIMVDKIALSVADIGSFSVLVFLFLFTFTLLGVELYSNTVRVDKNGTVDDSG
jgi:Ion transport protein